jgi:hypothetical protein
MIKSNLCFFKTVHDGRTGGTVLRFCHEVKCVKHIYIP